MNNNANDVKIGCTSLSSAFITLLTLLFVAGKIFGYLDWSWWLVFSPMLIEAGIVLIFLLIWFVMYIIGVCLNNNLRL